MAFVATFAPGDAFDPGAPDSEDALLTAPAQLLLPRVNLVLARLGLRTLSSWDESQWEEPTLAQAIHLMRFVLARGLAYDGRARSADAAERDAQELLDLGDRATRYLCNTDLFLTLDAKGERASRWSSGSSLTVATFEAGIIAVARRRIALLWVTDED